MPSRHSTGDPRQHYPVKAADDLTLHDALPKPYAAKEYKVVALRECPLPEDMKICDRPDVAADYWRLNIATNPYYNPHCECLAVLLLNTRKRVYGHQLVTIGTLDTLLAHPREMFVVAVAMRAAGIVLMHNHRERRAGPERGRHQSDPRFDSRRPIDECGYAVYSPNSYRLWVGSS